MRKSVIIGNVMIPSGVDRDSYVKYSIRTQTACIMTQDGDFIKDCPIASLNSGYNEGLQSSLVYPPTEDVFGSQIVALNVQGHNIPIIIGVLTPRGREGVLSEEYQFSLSRNFRQIDTDTNEEEDLSTVTIQGNGLSGLINILAESNNTDGGKINIHAINMDDTAQLTMKSSHIKLGSSQSVEVSSERSAEVNVHFYDDSSNEVKKHKILVDVDSILIEHNDGKKIEVKTDDIVFNDGSNDGMVKVTELVQKINALENSLNSLITLYNSHIHVTTATVGASAVVGVLSPTTSTSTDSIAPITQKSDIENPDVKH